MTTLEQLKNDYLAFVSIPMGASSAIDRRCYHIVIELATILSDTPPTDTDMRTEAYFLLVRIWVVARERGQGILAPHLKRYLIASGKELGLTNEGLASYGLL